MSDSNNISLVDDIQMSGSKKISMYEPYEITINSSKVYNVAENPWISVKLEGTFTHSSGKVIVVNAFWDGGNVFKIRFAPTIVGNWSFITASNTDTIQETSGKLFAATYIGDNALYKNGGFLKVSNNGRYLTYTNGKPFYYLSDTWWYGISDGYMPIETVLKPCLEKRKQQGFTVIITGMIGNMSGIEIQTAYHSKKDIQLKYWQGMDKVIKTIADSGMLIMLAPLWSGAKNWCNYTEWIELMNYLNARYSAYPIFFGVGPEYNAPDKCNSGLDELALNLLKHYSQIDPYQRALTIQPYPWNLVTHTNDWEKEYVDFIMLEGGHEDPFGIPTTLYKDAWYKKINGKNRPVALVETVWEGIGRNGYIHDDYTVRYNLYRAFLSGCTGMGYGSNGLWYPKQNEDDTTFEVDWGQSMPWYNALNRPGAQQAAYMKNYFISLDWWTLVPLFDAGMTNSNIKPPNIVNSIPSEDYYKPIAAKFEGGKKVVVYIPATFNLATPMNILLDNINKGNLKYKWLNPRSGMLSSGGTVNITTGNFILPQKPDTMDWILIIEE